MAPVQGAGTPLVHQRPGAACHRGVGLGRRFEQAEHPGGLAAGAEMTWLALLPSSAGIVAATGDCRLQLFEPQVLPLRLLPL